MPRKAKRGQPVRVTPREVMQMHGLEKIVESKSRLSDPVKIIEGAFGADTKRMEPLTLYLVYNRREGEWWATFFKNSIINIYIEVGKTGKYELDQSFLL